MILMLHHVPYASLRRSPLVSFLQHASMKNELHEHTLHSTRSLLNDFLLSEQTLARRLSDFLVIVHILPHYRTISRGKNCTPREPMTALFGTFGAESNFYGILIFDLLRALFSNNLFCNALVLYQSLAGGRWPRLLLLGFCQVDQLLRAFLIVGGTSLFFR
jgi:hypothetical protein